MKSKRIEEREGERTFALVFEPGDEVMAGLRAYAKEENLAAARLTAIGAFRDVTLGFFDPGRKEYHKIVLGEQVEVLSLLGNVAVQEDRPAVHALEAHVRPTPEVIVVESPRHLHRYHDKETGLALLRI